jgi:transketolase
MAHLNREGNFMTQNPDLDQLAIDTIRMLSIDAVQKANSGHPGTPLGAAPVAYTLWQYFLRYDPADPGWPNRDRFVLSAGHASMMLYSLLHLAGVRAAAPSYGPEAREAVSLDDIRTFRQAGSRCPGHPEHGWTSGVETTTGPLGQGAGTSVGMAIAGRWLAATFNRPGFDLFDYRVYALCGDGDLMEGVSAEAASLAGHLGLANLCWIYDSNRITIEGSTDLAFTEDPAIRFAAYGWNVLRVADANDRHALQEALQTYEAGADRPTLIVVSSHIGYGAPHKQDTAEAHGEPLGVEEVRRTKEFFGFPPDESFVVPAGVREHFAAHLGGRGARLREAWSRLLAEYRARHPEPAGQLARLLRRELPPDWESALPVFPPDPKGMSTRDASGKVLNALAASIPWIVGGAADLAPSTKTRLTFAGTGDFQAAGLEGDAGGRNFHFGVREHAMCAAVNGMTLCGLRAYGASFLVFSDYAKGAIRLAALMELPVLHVWTHDSIGLGEDGPTHQPVEQLAGLRAIPGLMVFRPADANETAEAYRSVLRRTDRPAALVCTRQGLPVLDRTELAPAAGAARGGYVLAKAPGGKPDVILMASGSEVHLCLAAREQLIAEGIRVRVVSLPSWELFEEQPPAYRELVLPPSIPARVAVEAASPLGWDRYTGPAGLILAMRGFGMSAPGAIAMSHFGFTPEHVAAAAREVLARTRPGAGWD